MLVSRFRGPESDCSQVKARMLWIPATQYIYVYIHIYMLCTSIQVEFGIRPSMKWEKPFWRLWRCAWDVHNIFLFEANCSGPSSENESARRTKAMVTISILLSQISSTISVHLPAVSEYECFHHHEQN